MKENKEQTTVSYDNKLKIDKSLEKYHGKILFPDKYNKAMEALKNADFVVRKQV